MITIDIKDIVTGNIELSINSIDQATIYLKKDERYDIFDKITITNGTNIIFSGIITDLQFNQSFSDQSYQITINSPLYLLKNNINEISSISFLQQFLNKCCDICGLTLDYRLDINPLIDLPENTDYYTILQKCVIFTKNWQNKYYMDYQNNKLVYGSSTDGLFPYNVTATNYSFEFDTEIITKIDY